MHSNTQTKTLTVGCAALCLVLTVLGLLHFGGVANKWMAVAAGCGAVVLLLRGDGKRLWNIPTLLLFGYAGFSWLTIFWAMSGKFHLREGSKILIALFFFLLVVLHKRFDGCFARQVLGVISGVSALYALMSVEAVTTGLCRTMMLRLGGEDMNIIFDGSRMYGIFGNSNIESSIFAIGIFCAIALVCGSEKKWQRVLFTVLLSFNAFAFLLVFSMGAMLCFVIAVVVYLIFAGNGRSAALLRMLEAAVPTLLCAFGAVALFNRAQPALVLVLMLVNAAVSVGLELSVSLRLAELLERHQKLAFGVLIAVAACGAVYAAAALNVTGPYTFGGSIIRIEALPAGEHTVQVDADGTVSLNIYTQNAVETMGNTSTGAYNGPAEGTVTITVPEDTRTAFVLSAEPGVTVRSVRIDDSIELPLRYKLLPSFAAARVQQFGMNSSSLLRALFREDAVKLFKLSPVVGNGVGAFETGVSRVQNYPYETKYVHQHYLQVLLEDGVIGLALFAGALVTMLAALWKSRKQPREGEFYWIYPALCAEFIMNGGQMCWDVSMSMIVFLCMTYAMYGLIVGACARPIGEKAAAEPLVGKKKNQKKPWDALRIAKTVEAVFAAAVVLTICGNLFAGAKMNAKAYNMNDFMSNLRTAARLDLYEHNDSKLSYVLASLNDDSDTFRVQADRYAEELSKVQSNTIPYYLVSYYLQTGQYSAAIDEAILSATYSASNAETWNGCAALLQDAFFDFTNGTPLMTDSETLIPKLGEYYDTLQNYNATALVPVTLDETAQNFFTNVAAICGK